MGGLCSQRQHGESAEGALPEQGSCWRGGEGGKAAAKLCAVRTELFLHLDYLEKVVTMLHAQQRGHGAGGSGRGWALTKRS